MSKVTSYPPGTFCWVDLTATDQEKAKTFYTSLFGWEAEDMPIGDGITYTMMRKNGLDASAIAPPMVQGAPSVWNSYVSVTDVNAATTRAKELGARILAAPMDVMDAGRMSAIADPQGAVVLLWQAGRHIGAGIVNEPGSFTWNELYSSDVEASKKFYGELFGWTFEVMTMPDGREYHNIQNKGRGAGGIMQITPDMGQMPPVWMVYFAVADIGESLTKAEELGATKHFDPMTIPNVGSFSMIADPVGAHLFLIQTEREPEPL